MSGVVSGITKTFQALGNAAVRVGKAVTGVGATTYAAGAASGAGSIASGGLAGVVQNFTGTGVLGNILTGAITQAGYGALIGGAVGAMTGTGFGKGALMGAAGGAISGGLFGAAGLNPDPLTSGFGQPPAADAGVVAASTATGVAPSGVTASAPPVIGSPGVAAPAAAAPVAAAPATGGFGQFMQSEAGGGLIAGLGQGIGGYMQSREKAAEAEADRQFLRDKEQRLTDSYDVDPAALHGAVAPDTGRPTPAQKYGRTRYSYDHAAGRIVQVPA